MIRKTLRTLKGTSAFGLAIANAFNPFYYMNVPQKTILQIAGHLFYVLLIVTFLTTAAGLPLLARMAAFASGTENPQLAIKAEIATTDPIEAEIPWLGNAKLLINTTASPNTEAGYDLIITSSEVTALPFACLIQREVCALFGIKPRSTPISTGDSSGIRAAVPAIAVIMLPGLLILLYISLMVKYAIVVMAATIIGYTAAKLANRGNSLISVFKTAAYASTTLIVLDLALTVMGSGPISMPAFAPLAAYAAVFSAAVVLNERQN
ncbi:TPA: hypothetical protein HA231_04070 [Candidatus Woesearchaeota archaeon]|nr:hypothetical protein [Candidatus Woesearchaeota archaeon]